MVNVATLRSEAKSIGMEKTKKLCAFYGSCLLDNIMPFWQKHSIDLDYGGYLTCLDRHGDVYDTDKSVWFQGRGAWMFAKLYNAVERKHEWLSAAKTGIDFLNMHCFDADGRMFFTVTRDGKPLQKRRYLFSETFAIIAFAEYAKASGDHAVMLQAKRLFDMVADIYRNGNITPKIDPNTRKTKSLALPMILLSTIQVLRDAGDVTEYDDFAGELLNTLFVDFVKPEEQALMETVGEGGERLDSPQGRCVNPGHSIETSWFLMQEGFYRQDNRIIVNARLTNPGLIFAGNNRQPSRWLALLQQ